MEVGSVIKHFRKKKGFTQEELADSICSTTYLSKVENNKMLPSDEIRDLVGERLGVDLSEALDSHNHEIKRNLYNLLNTIESMNRVEAKNIYDDVSLREIRFNNEVNQNYLFFIICKLRYLSFAEEWGSTEEEKNLVNEVEDNYEMYSEELLYYFHKHMGIYYISAMQNQNSNKHLSKAKGLYKVRQDADPELYYYLAMVNSKLKRNNLSIDFAEMALNLYQEKLNGERMLDTNMLLAINYNLLGDYANAEEKLRSIINFIPSKHDNRATLSMAYHNLGYIRKNQGNLNDALFFLNESLELKANNVSKLVSLYLKALVLFQLDKQKEALEVISIGYKFSEQYSSQKYYYKFYVLDNRVRKEVYGDEFIHELEEVVIPFFKEKGEYGDFLNYTELASQIFYEKKYYKKAADYYKTAYETIKGV